MVRKWEAMNYLQKFGKISMLSLLMAVPSVAFANTVVTSQTYVDMRLDEKVNNDQGSTNAGKVLVVGNDGIVTTAASNTVGADVSGKEDKSNKLNGTATTGQKIGDLAAGSAAGQDQVMYPSAAAVKEYAVAKNQGTGTNNANVGKALVVNSSGNLELGDVSVDISGKQAVSTANYQLGGASGSWKTLENGTYTTVGQGSNANNAKIDVNATTDGTLANADSGEADFAKLPTAGAVKAYVNSQSATAASNILTGTQSTTDTTHALTNAATTTALNDKQTKPASGVANGKVLTYTGTDANANVSAAYVTVPVAAGAPSTNTPTAFAEVWVQ